MLAVALVMALMALMAGQSAQHDRKAKFIFRGISTSDVSSSGSRSTSSSGNNTSSIVVLAAVVAQAAYDSSTSDGININASININLNYQCFCKHSPDIVQTRSTFLTTLYQKATFRSINFRNSLLITTKINICSHS